jgi:hypothetical protein
MSDSNKVKAQAAALKRLAGAERIRAAARLNFKNNKTFMNQVAQFNKAWANALASPNAPMVIESLHPGRAKILNRLGRSNRTPSMTNALRNVQRKLNFYLIEYRPHRPMLIPWRSIVAKNTHNARASPRKASPQRKSSPSPRKSSPGSPRKALTNYRGSIPGVRNSAHLARLIATAERKPRNTANMARQLARMGL